MAGIYLRDQVSGDLTLRTHCGLTQEFAEQVSYYAANTEWAQLVAKGTPVYSPYNLLPLGQDPVTYKSGIRALAVVPLSHEQAVIGCLCVASRSCDSLPPQTRMGIELLAAQAAGAIARIHAETDRQRLQSQILEISDREQARIGQEIHDGLCQQLVSLAFDANSLHRDLARSGRPEARVAARLAGYLDDTITQARQLSRGLFPIRLEDEGLISALQELARSTSTRFGKRCNFQSVAPGLRANTAMANNLFRIAQEAVTNAVKHAKPSSISVELRATAQEILLAVDDDGIGMPAARPPEGMGLHIMEYRARNIGGGLTINPRSHGGTRVCCCVPCAPPENIGL
jgi:signal transduction histidine kinase